MSVLSRINAPFAGLAVGLAVFLAGAPLAQSDGIANAELRAGEWTCFQTASPWHPSIDIRADVAIVYGVNDSLPQRVASWKEQGYRVALMTGVAWGEYQDYIEGRFDGKRHDDEGQVEQNGTRIMHGPTVPYMVPTPAYIEYLKSLLHRAIDAGVDALYLEEPEFWARGGYSEGFKREWQAFYGEPWQDPASGPEATYRSQQLKYHLYLRALDTLFADAKEYTRSKRGDDALMPCFVPTHSLINYTNWGIISPESLLAHSRYVDGYIAQVWTGTARTKNLYDGELAERTFESAVLEYGQMSAMTRPTGRRVYFLTDPIEDNPRYTWENYRENYHETFIAQLLHPEVSSYEIVPWPHRVFRGRYPAEGAAGRTRIPVDYATELQILFNAMAELHAAQPVEWRLGSDAGIGIALSDTMMFQREPRTADPHLSNFLGMALPWIKRGIGVQLVQLENIDRPDALQGVKILLTSFSFMKCKRPVELDRIVQWVRDDGGVCVLFDDGLDPFNGIREWWNEGLEPSEEAGPASRLLAMAGFGTGERMKRVGNGVFFWEPRDPLAFAEMANGSEELVSLVARVAAAAGMSEDSLSDRPAYDLSRGKFRIVAAPDEAPGQAPYALKGAFVDLFDPHLAVRTSPTIARGEEVFLVDPSRVERDAIFVPLATSARIEGRSDSKSPDGSLEVSLHLRAPARVRGILRFYTHRQPVGIRWKAKGDAAPQPVEQCPDLDASGTVLVEIPGFDPELEDAPLDGILTIFWLPEESYAT